MSPTAAAMVAYAVLVNLASVAAFGFDKYRAVRGGRRVPESTLLGLAASGGLAGALVAMPLFRHKTLKRSFRLKIWLIAAMWGGGAIAAWKCLGSAAAG